MKRFIFILFAGLSLFAFCSKQGNGPVPPDPAEPETPVPSDGNVRKSSFLVLREGGKLEFYHQWDFDLAFGNANYFADGNNGPTGWYVKDYDSNDNKGKGWYSRLFEDRAFVERVQARWDELYPELLKLDEFIDKAAEELGEGPGRNFKKWDILGTYVWPNVKVTGSYEEEVKYLKSFYLQRLEWMNRELAKL